MSRLDDDALISALSERARLVAAAHAGGEPAPGAWHRLEARRARAGIRALRRWSRRRWVLSSALTAVLGTVAGWGLWLRNTQLTFAVEGADARADGYIPRVAAALAQVKFSDGTEVDIEHGSRAWVISTGADGAQLRLEDGRAHFAVVHRPHAHWSVEAGPFVVWVTGTNFDVQWSSTNDLLRVHLRSGVVAVGGPQTRGGVTLLPGQVLEARPDEGILRVEPAPAETGAPSAARATLEKKVSGVATASSLTMPSAPPVPSTPLAPAGGVPSQDSVVRRMPEGWPAEHLPRATGARHRDQSLVTKSPWQADRGGDWKKKIAQGDFKQILKDAEARGMEDCLRSLPSDRLATLGDAARYAGQTVLARRVLQAQRERFAGSPAAAEATFLLGRLAEDAHEPGSAALPWYELYLAQAPSGAYAAEAQGRRMLILGSQDRGQRAREAARRYLVAFPRGAYVHQAHQILEGAP